MVIFPTACQVPGTGNYGFTVNCERHINFTNCLFQASCDPCAVPGCTDINATNYDYPTVDDGSCTYVYLW